MSQVKTTEIPGDVAIGRHVISGGDQTVRGNATVGKNLRVEGWLDARNLRTPCVGLFESVEMLREAFPNGRRGLWAVVAVTSPGRVWVWTEKGWRDTGRDFEFRVDDSAYSSALDALRGDVAGLQSGLSELESTCNAVFGEVMAKSVYCDSSGFILLKKLPTNYLLYKGDREMKSKLPEDIVYQADLTEDLVELRDEIGQETSVALKELRDDLGEAIVEATDELETRLEQSTAKALREQRADLTEDLVELRDEIGQETSAALKELRDDLGDHKVEYEDLKGTVESNRAAASESIDALAREDSEIRKEIAALRASTGIYPIAGIAESMASASGREGDVVFSRGEGYFVVKENGVWTYAAAPYNMNGPTYHWPYTDRLYRLGSALYRAERVDGRYELTELGGGNASDRPSGDTSDKPAGAGVGFRLLESASELNTFTPGAGEQILAFCMDSGVLYCWNYKTMLWEEIPLQTRLSDALGAMTSAMTERITKLEQSVAEALSLSEVDSICGSTLD